MLQKKALKHRTRNYFLTAILTLSISTLGSYFLHKDREYIQEVLDHNSEKIMGELSFEGKSLRLKYLDGMLDGGYKLDRELIGIGDRSWKD